MPEDALYSLYDVEKHQRVYVTADYDWASRLFERAVGHIRLVVNYPVELDRPGQVIAEKDERDG